MSREAFWELTIREFYRELVIQKRQREEEWDRDVAQAWHTVRLWAITRPKGKLPSLKETLALRKPKKPPTLTQQRAVLDILSAQMGIPLRKASRKKG